MRKLFITVALVMLALSLLGVGVHPAKAECCNAPSASNCYACTPQDGLSGVLQQQSGADTSFYQRAGSTASAELGVIVNITDYGRYAVRNVKTYQFLTDWEVTPAMRWRISEISTTGR